MIFLKRINFIFPILLAFLLYNIYNNNLIIYRIIRNIFASNLVDNLIPYYNNCSNELLVKKLQ